jgi:uncharacterized protein with ParB-like and HNH nuclease domain
MKAIDRPFTKIINGITQFVIPVFQRDYSWTEAECEQLWKDVTEIARDTTERGHFLGSVVYISTGDTSAGFTRWLLIDGQQRVTTLVLLLTALRDHIEESGWSGDDDGPTAKRVDAYFLRNIQEEGNRLHKLVLRRHDQTTLKALIDRTELPIEQSDRVRDNYEFFRDQLGKTDPGLVYQGVGRLVIVDVTLDRGTDDPQLIFESLNSTGMDLSQSDLIRNFVLMRLPEREQTLFYENYWSKIESLFRGSERLTHSSAITSRFIAKLVSKRRPEISIPRFVGYSDRLETSTLTWMPSYKSCSNLRATTPLLASAQMRRTPCDNRLRIFGVRWTSPLPSLCASTNATTTEL